MNRSLQTPNAVRCTCAAAAVVVTLGLSSFIDFLATRHVAGAPAVAQGQPTVLAQAGESRSVASRR